MITPVVSVLMPVYNGERFLDEAIRSIREQTFGDFEFVIVNDGSTDGSLDIVHRHAAEDARLVVLDVSNGGIVSALNAGLEACRGRYVARMDCDDIALPHRLERQQEWLHEHDEVDVLGSWVTVIDGEGETQRVIKTPETHKAIVADCIDSGTSAVFHPTWLARREFYERSGGYDKRFTGAEDSAMLLLNQATSQYANVPEELLKYRRHDSADGFAFRGRQARAVEAIVREVDAPSHILARHAYRASWASTLEGDYASGITYAWRAWRAAPLAPSGPKALASAVLGGISSVLPGQATGAKSAR